ncbi:MAG: Ig-like domain-containing protein [Thermoplasmata archaeon]
MGKARSGLRETVVLATLLLTSIVLSVPNAEAQTYVEGEIAGTQSWDLAGTPYIATGDLFVTGSLTIQPGVEVLFNDGYGLYVEGQLGAGNVLFDQNGTGLVPWRGIQFNSTSSGLAIVSCNITGSSVGVFIDGPSQPPSLDGSTIYGTGVGLIVNQSDPAIKLLQVRSSTMYSVVTSSSNLFLENSTLSGATNDFYLNNGSHVRILNTTYEGGISVIDAASNLTVDNYLHILVLDDGMNPLPTVDINVTDIPPTGPGQTVYSSPHFGGSDPQTDSSGNVGWITVTDRVYTNAGVLDNQTRIEVYYPGMVFLDNPRFVSMNSSHTETFVAMGPSEPPRVIDWSPKGNSTAVNTSINVTFNKSMNMTSVEESLRFNDGEIERDWRHGTFTWSSPSSFVFTPDEPYACCTSYNVTLLSSIAMDDTGQYLDGDGDGTPDPDFSWNFTTESGPPPEVNSTRPFNGEQDVSVSANIIMTFDRPMNESSVTAAFSYSDGISVWNSSHGEITWAATNHISDTMIFNPFGNLQTSTSYTATIDGTLAKDNCDSFLFGGTDYIWNFTTEPVDDDPPQVVDHIPQAGAVDVDVTTIIQVRFSENMDTDSVNNSFSYTDGISIWNMYDGNISWNPGKDVFTFIPIINLYYGRTYTVTLDASTAMDVYGNHLDGNNDGVGGMGDDDYVWSFTTEGVPDLDPPTVLSESPTGQDVPVTENIVVAFSELMDKSSVEGTFSYTDGVHTYDETDGTFDWVGSEMTFIPSSGLDYGTSYTVTISQSAMDLAGNRLSQEHSWSFITETGIGTIFGEVRDENGVRLADVTVRILVLDLTTHTSANGSYLFEDIPAGHHNLTYSKEGFHTARRSVSLEPNQTLELNVRMSHEFTLLDLWWMLLLIVILVIILIVLLFGRRRRAKSWPAAEDVAYVEPPEEPPPEISQPDD